MSIDFQNGFLCGMATKGMLRTENPYEPIIWNDEGEYNFFYIDFKRVMAPFSMGMLQASLVLHDSVQFPILNYQPTTSPTTYKIFCDLSDKVKGVTVINKKGTLLTFASARVLPPFSTQFYVAGLPTYIRKSYGYDVGHINEIEDAIKSVGQNEMTATFVEYGVTGVSDSANCADIVDPLTAAQSCTISYWST